MSAVQNDTLKINHCVNRAAPISIYRDWPASLVLYTHRRNTSFSLSFSCSPLPFFPSSPLFFLLFSLSFLPLFPFSLSLPADFWCGDRRHAAPLPTGLVSSGDVSSYTEPLTAQQAHSNTLVYFTTVLSKISIELHKFVCYSQIHLFGSCTNI